MKNDNRIHICMITDKNYVYPTCTVIKSIQVNKKESTKYLISILVQNISEDDIKLISSLQSESVNIEVLSDLDLSILNSNVNISRHVSKAAMLKFLIPLIFANEEKVLYLDSDVIVQDDLSDLYNISLEDFYAAVVKDIMCINGKNHFKNIKYKNNFYFNSGVILFNIKKCIEEDVTSKLVDYRINGLNHFMDQDAFNVVFADNVKFISCKYNLLNYFFKNFKLSELEKMYAEKFPSEIKEIYKSAKILHIGGKEKPWKEHLFYLSQLYKKYANMINWNYEIKPNISVIIPVYNAEQYLEKSIESLLKQKLENFEIICVNDGSTDLSLKILNKYAQEDGRFVIITQENRGSAAARNLGLKYAKGDYIAFIDSDDEINEIFLKSLYECAVSTQSDICATSSVFVFDGENFFPKKTGLEGKQMITSKEDKGQVIITTGILWNKIYKKTFIQEYNIKSLEVKNAAEDNYFTDCSIIMSNQIAVVDDAKYFYRKVESSQTQVIKDDKQITMVDVYKAIDEFINKNIFSKKDRRNWLKIIDKRKIVDYNLFQSTMYNFYHSLFEKEFITAFPNLRTKIKKTTNAPLIVSLTSYPARINTIHNTIKSILVQNVRPEKVVLALGEDKFPNKMLDLPQSLIDLQAYGLEILWCNDIKSFTKLIPALKKYSNKVIVTADDDVIYASDWLEKLYMAYLKKPNLVHCHRAHRVTFDKKEEIVKYNDWLWEISEVSPSFNNFLTGVGGVLYPINAFHKDILREDIFMRLCPNADDIWFWVMCVLKGTKVNVVKDNITKLKYVDGTQANCLWMRNVSNNQNDEQIRNVLDYYPELLRKINRKMTIDYIERNILEKAFSIKKDPIRQKHMIIMILGLKIKIKRKQTCGYSFAEKIFSVKNKESRDNKWYKVVTILGLKLSFKNKDLTLRKNIFRLNDSINGQNCRIEKLANDLTIQQKDFEDKIIFLNQQIEAQQHLINKLKQEYNQKILDERLKQRYKHHKYLPAEKRAEALKDWYFEMTGELLNLDNPQTFNEKIQWLKLYDSTSIKTRLADKYLVRDWVKEKIGEEYLIPLLGVYDCFDEIDFDKLPEQFVIKCNHGSGYNIIVKDKSLFDKEDARNKINSWMNEDYAFKAGFEMHYSDIPRKIIIEKFLDEISNNLYDYRFFCCNGKVEQIWLDVGSGTPEHKRKIYDKNWNELNIIVKWPRLEKDVPKPKNLGKMIEFSELMAKDFALVRVDFYDINDKIYFGEMTFTSMSGTGKFEPEVEDLKLGEKINLNVDNKE